MLRHKEPQYPLDKYLPRVPKRDDTFIKSREIPLQKDVSLFRKIESLLKESQCMREPIANCVLAPNEAPLNVSAESSVSTEDLVAAEFYKATYGTPKKVECSSKPKVTVVPPHKGAGDWVDVRSPHICELGPKPQTETDCHEGATAMQLPWDAHQRVSTLSPKPMQAETCFQRSSPQTFESFGHHKMPIEYGFNMGDNKNGKLSVSEIDQSHPKPKASEVCSFSSAPSVSIRTSASRLPYKRRTLKKVSVQNACINTDRVNTHVFSMKHPDPGVVDDFAGQSRVKACVVQELPKVNIRARLVRQSCGFVSINPVHVPSEVQNTAVVEVSHDLIEQPQDRYISQSNTQTHYNNHKMQASQPPEVEQRAKYPQKSSSKCFPNERQPLSCHKLAFDFGRRRAMAPQGLISDQNKKPKIFDTVSHFREQLSRDFNSGFESIKRSLSEMVTSLNEFCNVGLNNAQVLQNVSSTSKTHPCTVRDRVDQMDGILNEELEKWGQRDLAHYQLLTKAIDELTIEIKTAVESFNQQQHLDRRTAVFLEGSVTSAPPPNGAKHQNTVEAAHHPEPLRFDKLLAIHSYLQQNQPQAACQERSDPIPNHCKKEGNLMTTKTKFDETFTIDPSPLHEAQLTNIEDTLEEKDTSPQNENINNKGELQGDYEDDFIPEDQDDPDDQLSQSNSDEQKSDSSRSDKTAEDSEASKTEENLVVHLITSGSANGEESTDAPLAQRVQEEPPSSVASTINASQVNLKSRMKGCNVHKSFPVQTAFGPKVQKTTKSADDVSDKPLVRLTNRNTNAVFELRLPEQLENLNSTLTYNSVGCNDEIKLSFGCAGLKEKARTAVPENVPVDGPAVLDNDVEPKVVHNQIHPGDSIGLPIPSLNYELPKMHIAGAVVNDSSHLPGIESHTGRRVTVGTEPQHNIPRALRNQATQFPTVEMESVERLSASILTLVESKMNEIVEINKMKVLSNESKCRDFSVQVVPGPELGERQISAVLEGPKPTASADQDLSYTDPYTPPKATHDFQITPNITPLHSDGYDSHPKNLDKPTEYLILKQTEREVENLLVQNSQFPVQLESSFSSISIPTSLSEFHVKSSSSSELAFPLDQVSDPVTNLDDLHKLHPAPEFDDVSMADSSKDGHKGQRDVESGDNSLGDISSHLHPNPEDLPGFHPEICAEPEETKGAGGNAESAKLVTVIDGMKPSHASIHEIQPYDSDLMSEGEVGYVYTSNSYSSGEIVERRRTNTAVRSGQQGFKDVRTCSEEGVDKNAEERISFDLDSCADDTSRLNEDMSSTTETTTSETSPES